MSDGSEVAGMGMEERKRGREGRRGGGAGVGKGMKARRWCNKGRASWPPGMEEERRSELASLCQRGSRARAGTWVREQVKQMSFVVLDTDPYNVVCLPFVFDARCFGVQSSS